jgi:acetylornithine deacetylase/succinyl-diaminopimelate desuccinylase-like protein
MPKGFINLEANHNSMDTLNKYIAQNQDRFINELFGLLRIPSVSADKGNAEAMRTAAEYVKQQLLNAGVDRAEVMATKGWPVVFAEKIMDRNLPTILIYGHYDVQPPDPLNEWQSPPFEPEIRDGKIFARGADDDKGQLFIHLKAFEYLVLEHKLPCNVKFIIEGEEEVGSPSLKDFCIEHKKLLAANVIVVSDTTMLSLEVPTLTIGLRGLAYFELIINGPNRDLHSGLYGGVVNNPANVLATLIAGMKDKEGRITIPGFYDDVLPLTLEEKALLNNVPLKEKELAESIGVSSLFGENEYTVIERIGSRPTLDVNGIFGGYTGEGAKTILPAKATAKISTRLVPNQNPDNIEKLLKAHLKRVIPAGVEYRLDPLHGGNPYLTPWNSNEAQAAVEAIKKSFGKSPLPVRSGGSIPVIADFEEVLGIKAVLLGFGLESDAIHSPNENFPVANLLKGIETVPWFYHYYMNR